MHLPAPFLVWLKSVTAPLLGWDPRPLGLRDTLPDQTRPTVPDLVGASSSPNGPGVTVHVNPTSVGTCAK
jgi:hypothetical protein